MSRKKIKKDVVKRKTNIYDPMGVYGRGLTENQRLGMTRQMKIENIRDQKKVLTKKDLEEYQKILEFYGIHRVIRAGNIINMSIPFNLSILDAYRNVEILAKLNSVGIQPRFFVCDTFVISREEDVAWSTDVHYYIVVGNTRFGVIPQAGHYEISTGDPSVTIPRWFINGTQMNYFQLLYDNDLSDMYIRQSYHDISDQQQYVDFSSLPKDGTPIPYLLYPNNNFPELQIEAGFNSTPSDSYKIIFNVLVIY